MNPLKKKLLNQVITLKLSLDINSQLRDLQISIIKLKNEALCQEALSILSKIETIYFNSEGEGRSLTAHEFETMNLHIDELETLLKQKAFPYKTFGALTLVSLLIPSLQPLGILLSVFLILKKLTE